MNVQQIRDEFETAAHDGYVSYGLSMTDGYYAPEPRSATVATLHRSVPVKPEDFWYNTDFKPSQAECDAYNATFEVGASWRPDYLNLAVQWDKGWKTYRVTGTRHAYYLLRKFAGRRGFKGARLEEILVGTNGYATPNVIALTDDDITGSDRFGKYRSLLDKNNTHYDLEHDDKERARAARQAEEDELGRRETQSDRDAWYDMDR